MIHFNIIPWNTFMICVFHINFIISIGMMFPPLWNYHSQYVHCESVTLSWTLHWSKNSSRCTFILNKYCNMNLNAIMSLEFVIPLSLMEKINFFTWSVFFIAWCIILLAMMPIVAPLRFAALRHWWNFFYLCKPSIIACQILCWGLPFFTSSTWQPWAAIET